jgi:RHS repeat-associated protein
MNVAAHLDREASPDAMWRAVRALGPHVETESKIGGVSNLAQSFDYAPYGSLLAGSNTGATTVARQFIGQYSDASGLDYLNARYYQPAQGQFLTEDPVFVGDPRQQNLNDPQSLNSYSYSEDNPILEEDPSGRCPECVTALLGAGAAVAAQYAIDVGGNINANGLNATDFYTGLSSPETYLTRAVQGAVIGATGGVAGTSLSGLGLFGQSAVVGGTSGAVGALGNAILGQPVPRSQSFSTRQSAG